MTQKEALDILKLGHNVFLTGPAGSGKTFLLEKYVGYLRKNGIGVGITASTGIAASHISGITIHSWSGLKVIEAGMSRKKIEARIKKIVKNDNSRERITKASVLIIDEISMLDAEYLNLVDRVCQTVKQSIQAFGGIQIIFSGDFFQLPPVNKGEEEGKRFAYLSKAWQKAGLKICYLSEQHRHIDKKYARVLGDIRKNKVKKENLETLKSRLNKPVKSAVEATKLYTTNAQVDAINDYELSRIPGKEYNYEMQSGCKKDNEYVLKQLLATAQIIPTTLRLKVGAVVMFIKNNFDKSGANTYVNGTLGRVINFSKDSKLPIVETTDKRIITAVPQSWKIMEDDTTILAWLRQIPLRPAWAITVHKSQGMSLDEAIIDLSNTFEYGMGYVALSRVRSLNGMCLLGLNKLAVKVDPEVVKLDRQFIKESKKAAADLSKMSKKEIVEQQKRFIKLNSEENKKADLFDEVFQ
jgi:ATP-dependent DNA helicase PIF1